jgi:hypothetical protein
MDIQFLQRKSKRFLGYLTIILVVAACQPKKVLNIDEVFALKPSHSITNDTIYGLLKNYDSKGLYHDDDDMYIIHVRKTKGSNYKLGIAKSDFPNFRKEASNFHYFKNLKGYLKYNKNIVLLYGDIDGTFFDEISSPEDIMYNEFINSGKTIYEPHFIDYYYVKKE